MNKKTKEALERFFGMNTWTTGHPCDEGRFFNFIAVAYRNNDHNISQSDLEGIGKEIREKNLSEYELECLRSLHSKYIDGVDIIKKYTES